MRSSIAALFAVLMSVTGCVHGGVRIVLDYSMDTNGFFTPARREIAQAAADSLTSRMSNTLWERVDTSMAGGSYELAVINPSTMAVSWVSNAVIPENQITVRLGAMDWSKSSVSRFRESRGDSVTQLLSIRNVNGGIAQVLTNPSKLRPVDASISFDLQGAQGLSPQITRQWYFGLAANLNTDDRNPADHYYANYTDFYTSLIHELGHVLGIYDPVSAAGSLRTSAPDFYNSIASDPNFYNAWTSRIEADGLGGVVFKGSRASQLYYNHVGQAIPLDAATRSHWADGVHSQTAGGWLSVSYDQGAPFRYGFSELEFAALQDMGYVITPASSDSVQSGWWWNAAEPGRGYFIEVKNGRFYTASYLYDTSGNALWYVTGPGNVSGSTLPGTLNAYSGGQTLTGAYKLPAGPNSAGSMSISFTDATHGTITWPGGSVPITRYELASGSLNQPDPSFKPETGWWWNASEGGRGFSIEVQGDNMFVAGFMYDGSGSPVWYVSAGKMTSPTVYQGNWVQYGNGQSMGGAFRMATVKNPNVGGMAIGFSSTTTATMYLPDGRTIPLTRYSF